MKATGKGKEEEGTEPGLGDTGPFSADLEAAAETKDIGVSGAGSLRGQDCGEPVSRKTSGTEFLLNQGRCWLG